MDLDLGRAVLDDGLRLHCSIAGGGAVGPGTVEKYTDYATTQRIRWSEDHRSGSRRSGHVVFQLEADSLYLLRGIATGSRSSCDFLLSTYGEPRDLTEAEFDAERARLWPAGRDDFLRKQEKAAAEAEEKRRLDQALSDFRASLPALIGSEKQVRWAQDIRYDWVSRFDRGVRALDYYDTDLRGLRYDDTQNADRIRRVGGDTPEALDAIRAAIRAQDSAKFWIDNRESWWETLRALMAKPEAVIEPAPAPEAAAKLARELEAKAEATLAPAQPKTTILTELAFRDSLLRARAEAYIEGLGDVLRPLGFEWDKEHREWWRTVGDLAGDPIDRIAETAAKLVKSGLPAVVFDEEARLRVIENAWTPEVRKWVFVGGKKGDKFVLSYPYDENHYEQCRRLRGAKYLDRGRFSVPVSSYEEVVDFADRYGFGITSDARALIDAACAADGHVVTAIPSIPETTVEQVHDVPQPLDVPESVEIDGGLLDA